MIPYIQYMDTYFHLQPTHHTSTNLPQPCFQLPLLPPIHPYPCHATLHIQRHLLSRLQHQILTTPHTPILLFNQLIHLTLSNNPPYLPLCEVHHGRRAVKRGNKQRVAVITPAQVRNAFAERFLDDDDGLGVLFPDAECLVGAAEREEAFGFVGVDHGAVALFALVVHARGGGDCNDLVVVWKIKG